MHTTKKIVKISFKKFKCFIRKYLLNAKESGKGGLEAKKEKKKTRHTENEKYSGRGKSNYINNNSKCGLNIQRADFSDCVYYPTICY